ncbi:S49 family peptidase [Alcaligenes phenolicus]
MTHLAHIATRLINVPLLITPEYGSVVTSVLADRIGVHSKVSDELIKSYVRPNSSQTLDERNGIVTLPIVGGLIHRGGELEAMSGMQSYTRLHNRLEALFASDDVRGILLDIDSGGGEAAGLAELVDWLPKASKQAGKPVWGIANTSAGSAAYWLASATGRLFASHHSRVGSIGVYVQHVDMSKATNRGLDEKVVRATQAKVYGAEDAQAIGLVDGIGGLGSVLTAFAEYLRPSQVGYRPS